MLPTGSPNTNEGLNPANGAIIAETGVTGQVSIDNLFLKAYLAGSHQSRTSVASKITFTLKEHNGAGLLDKMKYTADQLGMLSFQSDPYYLELSFKADNEPNASDAVALPYVYRWPIIITKIDVQVTASGTTYDVVGTFQAGVANVDNIVSTNVNGSIKVQSDGDKGAASGNNGEITPVMASTAKTPVPAKTPASNVGGTTSTRVGPRGVGRSPTPTVPAASTQSFAASAQSFAANVSTLSSPATFEIVDAPLENYLPYVPPGGEQEPGPTITTRSKEGRLVEYKYDPETSTNGRIDNFQASKANTVGEALEFLAAILSIRAVDAGKQTDYRIIVDPTIANFRMHPNGESDTGRTKSMNNVSYDAGTNSYVYTFEEGLDVPSMIERILLTSPDYQKYSVQSDIDNGITPDPAKLKQIHKISAKYQNLAGEDIIPKDRFNPERLAFYVRPFQLPVITSQADVSVPVVERLQAYVDAGLLKKHYFYLFTGQNDQILNLDLKFQFNWYVNLPNNGGQFTTTGNSGVGEIKTETFDERRERANKAGNTLTDTVGLARRIRNRELRPSDDVRTQIATGPAVPETAKKQDKLPATSTTTPVEEGPMKSKIRFVEDAFDTKNDNRVPIENSSSPKSTDESRITSQSTEMARGPGRGWVNNLFKAAFSVESGDLATIEMKIKGDTYWLGESTSTGVPDPAENGSAAFVLSVKSPSLYDDSGIAAPHVNLMSGLYTVLSVDHEFSQGVFTQTLYGTVDSSISNLDEVINQQQSQ